MLFNILKSLFTTSAVKHEAIESKIHKLLRDKRPGEAKDYLISESWYNASTPEHMCVLGEVEFHLKNLPEAKRLCIDALSRKPSIPNAHYVLSLVYYEQNRFDEAMAQAICARNLAPHEPRYNAQTGLCAIQQHNFSFARDILRQVVLQDPENVPALNNLGIAHHALGEIDLSLYCFERALALDQAYSPLRENMMNLYGVDAYSSRFDSDTNSLVCQLSGNKITHLHYSPEEEYTLSESLEARFESNPDNPNWAIELIQHYLDTYKLEQASDIMHLTLACHPEDSQVLTLAGRISQMLDHLDDALLLFQRALFFENENIDALLGYGQVLRDMERVEESLAPIEKAAELEDSPRTLTQLAFALSNACKYEDALLICKRIEDQYPNISPILNSTRLVSLTYLGRFEEAKEFLGNPEDKASFTPAHSTFVGIIDLMHENYNTGWDGYHFRLIHDTQNSRLLPYPVWQGEDLTGKIILVLAEQGLGDQVMFASCLPDLLALLPKKVYLEAHIRVAKTLMRSFPNIQVFPSGQRGFDWLPQNAPPDCYIDIADLPRFFRRSVESFPQHSGYLAPDAARTLYWRDKLAMFNSLPKIGISWKGGVQKTRRAVRSMSLEEMAPILANPHFQFVNLQYGEAAEEIRRYQVRHKSHILNWPEAIQDLDEFAALIAALDLTITVCNTTVHYAGAIGKACWVMTPTIPEWRYGLTVNSMRWYPSTRMIRQSSAGDWADVVNRVAHFLNAWQQTDSHTA